jgi:Uma2 family endonuclease
MRSSLPKPLVAIQYFEAMQSYLRSLPLEHFMEAIPHATQRKITLESLDLVHAQRPEVQIFNELLVQYPRDEEHEDIGQVVPDNMVVISEQQIGKVGSFDFPLQTARPFWVLEYVSKNTKRKDYKDNFEKYEKELKVPYFLLFDPETQELTLNQFKRGRYRKAAPNEFGRLAIPELDLEVAVHEGWVRFWFRGELLSLPGDLLRELRETKRLLSEASAETVRERDARLAVEAENARLRAFLQERGLSPDSN